MAGIRTFHLRILTPVLVLMQVLFVAQIASAAKPPPPPLAPSILTATPYSNSQINLAWNDPNTGSGSPSESGYQVERTTPPSTTWTNVFTSGPNIKTWSNIGLAASTTYSYRVRAFTFTVTQRKTTYSGYSPVVTAATLGGTNQSPVANAGPNQSAQTLNSLTFNGSGSNDPDGTISSYAWTFGDGATGSGMTVSHAYASAGSYTATLTVTDNLGARGSASTTATIMNRPPVANAGPDQSTPVGGSVTLNGSGSSDPDGSIASYAWNFGDGATASGVSVAHAYSTAGTYAATLTVTDNRGAVASDQAVITVTTATAGGAYRWANRIGGAGVSVAPYASAVDSSGNVVVVGAFSGTVNFGGGPLTSAGGSDIYVAKYSSTGTHLWSRRVGDASTSTAYGVAVDTSGSVVVVGNFTGTVNFGGGPLTSAGGLDIFVAKFSSTGGYLWSQRYGGSRDESANSVAVDISGNVVVTGSFQGTVSFGGSSILSYGGSTDMFLAKYSSAGLHVWSKAFGGQGSDAFNGVAVDRSGNIIVTGYFQYSVDFGGGALVANGSDVVVAKYSPAGAYLWSTRFGDTGTDVGYAVAADVSGNVVVTGYVQGTVNFGGGPTPGNGSQDAFVAKYSSAGAYAWSRRLGSVSTDEGLSLAMDPSGNVLVAGAYQGTIDFGRGPLTSAGSWDVFVAKYSAAGAAQWSKSYGNAGYDFAYSVTSDGSGNPIVTGTIQGAVNLGGGLLPSVGYSDMFILGLGP